MPIYEYACRACGKRSSLFVRSVFSQIEPVCSHCGNRNLERVISSFIYHKAPQGRGGESSSSGMDYYKDPRNIGRHLEESFEKYGVDIPDSVKETIAAAREGEMPKDLDM